MVVVEFAARRRVRINGTLTQVTGGGLVLEVEQAYGNCPQYIQQRVLGFGYPGGSEATEVRRGTDFSPGDVSLIRGADTFFLGTTHPERDTDASHRGGSPASCSWRAISCGGPTTPATICSTASATSP